VTDAVAAIYSHYCYIKQNEKKRKKEISEFVTQWFIYFVIRITIIYPEIRIFYCIFYLSGCEKIWFQNMGSKDKLFHNYVFLCIHAVLTRCSSKLTSKPSTIFIPSSFYCGKALHGFVVTTLEITHMPGCSYVEMHGLVSQ
jgi:hypothetical protein